MAFFVVVKNQLDRPTAQLRCNLPFNFFEVCSAHAIASFKRMRNTYTCTFKNDTCYNSQLLVYLGFACVQ